jgi:uncharacterized membrane protein
MSKSEIVIYKSSEGKTEIQVKLEGDTIWLSQRQMAELFEKDTDTIGLHLSSIFQTRELDEKSTTEEYSVVQIEGVRKVKRKIKHYNLDAVISVGYRVNSKRGTQFRIWANKILRELNYSAGKKINHLEVRSVLFIKLSMEKTFIQALRRKQQIYFTSSRKIIPLRMGTNALLLFCSYISWIKTGSYMIAQAEKESLIMPWSL